MRETWFEPGGGGFNVTPDSGLTALTDLVDQVVPIPQARRRGPVAAPLPLLGTIAEQI